MVGWHHRLDGHGFEQAPGVGDGQGGLACCSPWGCKESDTTERLDWNWWVSLFRLLFSCSPLLCINSTGIKHRGQTPQAPKTAVWLSDTHGLLAAQGVLNTHSPPGNAGCSSPAPLLTNWASLVVGWCLLFSSSNVTTVYNFLNPRAQKLRPLTEFAREV